MRACVAVAVWSCLLALLACSSNPGSIQQIDVLPSDSEKPDALHDVAEDSALLPELPPVDAPASEAVFELERSAPELVDLAPQPGEPGYPCGKPSDCLSDLCILTPDGPLCSQTCDSECPFGWQCVPYSAALPDLVSICAPRFVTLCRPCTTDSDCDPDNIGKGDRCLPYPGGIGSFCGAACAGPGDCPAGYECQDTARPGDAAEMQCRLVLGECACDQFAIEDLATTACFVENVLGKCDGTRSCTADGLSACTAATPADEICNGEDDDCDKVADEGTGGDECLVENEHGKCAGTTKCVAAELECSAKEPMKEACDGADNDCDGETDEGYPDTDQDGTADCLETDADGDGTPDYQDNCPYVPNEDQANFDMDSLGDACDQDDDNDLSADDLDCAPFDPAVHPGADEECDGLDNDCDDKTDEDFPLGDACSLGIGACKADGSYVCAKDGTAVCNALPGKPAGELCDGLDNDCDDKTDEDFPLGNACSLGIGACKADGSYVCAQDGTAACNALPGKPVDELCDGLDNDCNTKVDDLPLLGKGCDKSGYPGICAAGLYQCDPGGKGLWCQALVLPNQQKESCANPGQDDNCDGIADNVPNLGMNCLDIAYKGVCQQGTYQCKNAQLTCVPSILPGQLVEQCNNKDDDCDGLIDPPGTSGCMTWFKDADGDGHGAPGDSQCICSPDTPYTASAGDDCDDSHAGLVTACDLVGDGSDGELNVVGSFEMNATKTGGRQDPDGVAWKVTAPIVGKEVPLESVSGLAKDDLALLIDLQGPGTSVGKWEVVRIASVQGLVVTLAAEAANAYDTAADIVVLQRIPQYKKLTVAGEIRATQFGKFPAGTAGGSRATGIVAIKVRETLEIQAGSKVTADAAGFVGGQTGSAPQGPTGITAQGGDSGATGTWNAGGSGGGIAGAVKGGKGANSCSDPGGAGGLGGGGGGGKTWHCAGGPPPTGGAGGGGGASYDGLANETPADFSLLVHGGGASAGAGGGQSGANAGSGQTTSPGGAPAAGTPGTPGGGIILLWARNVVLPGTITSTGGAGGTGNPGQSRDGPGSDDGAGGGGEGGQGAAGGTIQIVCETLTAGAASILAMAGPGGNGGNGGDGWGGGGGAAGIGAPTGGLPTSGSDAKYSGDGGASGGGGAGGPAGDIGAIRIVAAGINGKSVPSPDADLAAAGVCGSPPDSLAVWIP